MDGLDPLDPANHGKPLWVVHDGGYGKFSPIIWCVKLFAYDASHNLLPVGTRGDHVAIWGYSVWKRRPGFRTYGSSVTEWLESKHGHGAVFFEDHELALDHIRKAIRARSIEAIAEAFRCLDSALRDELSEDGP